MDEVSKAIAKSQAKARAPKKKRARNTDPRKVTSSGITQRARIQAATVALRQGEGRIERVFDNKRQRVLDRYQTKASLEKKVRAEIASGKLPKGSFGKTVARRWKAQQKRRQAALEKLQTEKISALAKLRADLAQNPPMPKMSRVRALITYRLSEDIKTVTLEFVTSEGNFWEDSYDALLAYIMDESVEMISSELLEVLEEL